MERNGRLSSKVRWLAVAALLAGTAAAALTPGMRALYSARLAETAAGRFTTLALSPTLNPATDPLMDAVVQWDRLRRDSGPATFAEIAAFLHAHRGWPAETTLRRRAERLCDANVPAGERLAFFRDFPPLSATAHLRLAEAYRLGGDPALAAGEARAAWTSGGLDPASETALLGEFASALTPADHIARLDRLLWHGELPAAERMLARVPLDPGTLAVARLRLRRGAGEEAVHGVPASLQGDAGLTYDRAAAAKRRGDVGEARRIMADYAGPPGLVAEPDMWLKLRLELARGAMRDGDANLAYRIAGGHRPFALGRSLAEHDLAVRQALIDTEWLAGWLALRRLGRPEVALTHFERVRDTALTPVSQARGDYWAGRAAEAAGRDARLYYAAAATHADYYYGQLADEHVRPTADNSPGHPGRGIARGATRVRGRRTRPGRARPRRNRRPLTADVVYQGLGRAG